MKRLLVCLAVLLLTISCGEKEEPRIPYRPVNLELHLADRDKALVGLNTHKLYTAKVSATDKLGYGGVLVYHTVFDDFVAYDLACPYEANASTRVAVDEEEDLYVVCPACGSKYELTTGRPEPGSVSTYRLQPYNVYRQSASNLIVQH